MAQTIKHTSKPATDKQMSYLAALARKAGYAHPSQAIKEVIGKNPINGLNRARASMVIDELKSR